MRELFETTVRRCIEEGLVGGEGFAVDASRAIRQAEVGVARTMIERTQDHFGLYPERLAADSAYAGDQFGMRCHGCPLLNAVQRHIGSDNF